MTDRAAEDWDADLRLAHQLADAADTITAHRFGAADLSVAAKADASFVTDADREAETALRELLAGQRPADGVLGEEGGETAGHTSRRWVIDPIDGTHNYLRGVPVWATLIALESAGEPVVAVVSAPALQRRWWARRGGGAYAGVTGGDTVTGGGTATGGLAGRSGRRLAVSRVARLEQAFFSYSSLSGWRAADRRAAVLELLDTVWRSRAFGDFWSYLLVAEGAVDLAAEPEVSRWDLAAVCLLVTEAGGRFTDLAGAAGPGGGSALASNGLLHAAAQRILSSQIPT